MSDEQRGSTAAGRTDMDSTHHDGTTDGTLAQRGAVPDHAPQIPGTTAAPTLFENPGLPPHVTRLADTDPRAAKRAERQVAAMFTLSILGTLVFLVSYFAVDKERSAYIPLLGNVLVLHLLLGLGLTFGIFFIGIGAVHWAKTLMPDEEVVEERHYLRSTDKDRAEAAETLQQGVEESGIARRPLIKVTLGGALGLFALPFVLSLRDLGPLPGNTAEGRTSMWKEGLRLVSDRIYTPIKAEDVTIGSVFHVMPEGIEKVEHELEERAKSAVLLMRLDPADITSEKEKGMGYEGIVAYSKICTHVGCPVGLYEQQTHHLLCPCHQSTFDVTQDCKVIFGPAGRPLPQLPIKVDAEGYLVAASGFLEAVGPSYPERGHR
jgi:ubiquinol-cytochrome c reductase iron-sulfur subunit